MSFMSELLKYENPSVGIPTTLSPQGVTLANNNRIIELGANSSKKNFLLRRSKILDDMTDAATNWAVTTGTITKENSSEFTLPHMNSTNALKVTVGNSFARIQRTIPNTVFTGTIDTWFYIPNDPAGSHSFSIGVSKDNFATTAIEWAVNGFLFLKAGWNRISLNVTEDGTTFHPGTGAPVVTGTISFADTMNAVRITFGGWQANSPETGQPMPCYIGGIYHNGESNANIILNWDDAWSTQYNIFNIFRSRGLTGSISVIPGMVVNGSSGLTLKQLKEIYDWGWDLVNHTGIMGADNLVDKTPAQAKALIEQGRDWLIANGFSRAANVLVYPENATNRALMGIAKECGVVLARASKNANTRTGQGIDNTMSLGSADFGGKTLAQAKKQLDAAEKYKCTMILYGHKMVGTATVPAAGGAAPTDTLEWNQSDYLAIADDIADRVTAGTINNINYSQFLAECRV